MSIDNEITINGVKYFKQQEDGECLGRHLVVIDRGWIYAGDLYEADTRLILKRPVLIVQITSISFAGIIELSKNRANVDYRPHNKENSPVNVPKFSEIFRVKVDENWGLDDA